jgi:hypothetical protein
VGNRTFHEYDDQYRYWYKGCNRLTSVDFNDGGGSWDVDAKTYYFFKLLSMLIWFLSGILTSLWVI